MIQKCMLLMDSDGYSNVIRQVLMNDLNVSTLAGTGDQGYVDGSCENAQFLYPTGTILDTETNSIYACDYVNNVIRLIQLSPCAVSTFAGSSAYGHLDGIGTAAQFCGPWGIAIDYLNKLLYVTE